MKALVGAVQPRRQAMVMNGCWAPADGCSGHDRGVSENDADKWVLIGHTHRQVWRDARVEVVAHIYVYIAT